MTELILVRHGNTFDPGDIPRRVGGRTDMSLSNSGREQAAKLGRYFAKIRLDSLTSSPLTRTRQTAEAIASAQSFPIRVRTARFLEEIDYGIDENEPEELVVKRLGQAALDAWETDARMPEAWSPRPEQIRGLWAAWLSAFLMCARQDETHMIVTSNGIARFFLYEVRLKNPPDTIKLKTGAFARFRLDPDGTGETLAWNVRA